MVVNELVAYKRGGPGQNKMATGINYCQNGFLEKSKITLVEALSHSLLVFLKKKECTFNKAIGVSNIRSYPSLSLASVRV